MGKLLSCHERKCISFAHKNDLTPRSTVRKVRTKKLDQRTNRIVTNVEMKTIDRKEEMKPYKVSDFFLENLMAIGAELNASMLTASPTKSVSDMVRTFENLELETIS